MSALQTSCRGDTPSRHEILRMRALHRRSCWSATALRDGDGEMRRRYAPGRSNAIDVVPGFTTRDHFLCKRRTCDGSRLLADGAGTGCGTGNPSWRLM